MGPIAGPSVAVMPNSIRPNGRFSGGSLMFTIVNAIGIMTPPVNPWAARKAIISTRLDATPHSIEKATNRIALTTR